MHTSVTGWTTIATDPLVLQREYAFGAGTANTLAVGLPGRKLLLVSPPVGLPDSELEELSQHGEVIAMVAINGAHHLGLPACRKLFPRAVSYATPDAQARIRRRTRGHGHGHGGNDGLQFEPLEQLLPLLGDKVHILAAPGCRIGDVLIRVLTEKGTLLYTGDFIANIPKLPKNILFKWMFRLTDSGPGLKVFRIFFKFFVSEPRVVRDFLVREIEARPPAIVVPGHGDTVTGSQLGPTLIALLLAAVK